MPSLLPGFEYDIFISYRHNDNRSGWVAEFVKALQEELASTLKDPVSVYFDSNPHDGLLETHNVDKSLEGKLKCLIFIPIISQTYCDTKSFAWQQELLIFNKMAKESQLGRDIRLSNGNVASRILPVRIHDLDDDDKALLEKELGGMLRAVEFIFRSAGVNRPLRLIEEHLQDNQNKTFYRDQVNKVANAIKEIIGAIKNPGATSPLTPLRNGEGNTNSRGKEFEATSQAVSPSKSRRIAAMAAALILLSSLAGYFLYGKFVPDKTELGKSIAVLYFDNISSEPGQEYFSDGITDEITSHLASIKGLRVTSRTSMIAYKGKGKALNIREIAEELNVDNVLEGSVRKSGDKLRIMAQLIDARNGSVIWTDVYNRDLTDVFNIQSEIAHAIAERFKVSISPQSAAKIEAVPTKNMEAYALYLKAKTIPWGTGGGIGTYFGGLEQAAKLCKQAIILDPDFAQPYAMLSEIESYKAFMFQFNNNEVVNFDSATFYAKEAVLRNPKAAAGYVQLAKTYAYIGDSKSAVLWLSKAAELDSIAALAGAGELYMASDGRRTIKIYSQLIKMNPMRPEPYVEKARAYFYLDQQDSVNKYIRLAQSLAHDVPEVYRILMHQAQIKGDVRATHEFAKRWFRDDTLSYNKEMGIACLIARNWREAERYYLRTHYRDMDWGLVLLKTGRVDSGMAVLKRVAAIRDRANDVVNAGRVYAAAGNKKKAIAMFQSAHEPYFYNVNWLKNDPFIDDIRQEPVFKGYIAAMEKWYGEQMKGIKEDERKKFNLEF